MQTVTEAERKYDVPDGLILPDVGPTGESETHTLVAAYYDTEDLRLLTARMTLRRRTGGSDAGWHLKTPGDGADRTEHRLPLGDDDGEVPGEIVQRVRAVVRGRPIRRVATLRTTRIETPLLDDDGTVLALIADDTVDAEAYGEARHWREVEVELVEGPERVLDEVELALRAAGATRAAGPSKLGRVLGDRVPSPPARPADRVGAYAAAQRDAIVANDPAARGGDEDAVHDMRVAIRRLRSTLKTFRARWDGGRADRLRVELSWLAHALGAVRDAQVMQARLSTITTDQQFAPIHKPVHDMLDDDVARGREELAAALDDSRYYAVLDEVDAMVTAAPRPGVRPGRRARRALARADAKLAAAEQDVEFHAARKAYKRARYAAEIYGKRTKGLVKALTRMQDVLGEHQDAVVTATLLRDRAPRRDGFLYGVLHARQLQEGEESLRRLPDASRSVRRRRKNL